MLQMKQNREDVFVSRLILRLRTRYPAKTATWPPSELRAWTNTAIDRSRKLNILASTNIQFVVEFLFQHGEDCLDQPEYSWAAEILKHPDQNETTRVNRLSEYQIFGRPGRVRNSGLAMAVTR